LEEGEVGPGDVWKRLARNENAISVLQCYRSSFQEGD
jgi:hypothetical protein